MQQDPFARNRHLDFIKTIVKKQKVYSIDDSEGIASAESLVFNTEENTDDNKRGLLFFWSEKRLAQKHCTQEWADYQPSEISLAKFLEDWCIGMHTDNIVAGTNFDMNLIGYEVEPLELIISILSKVKKSGYDLKLTRYESMGAFEKLVREHLAEKEA